MLVWRASHRAYLPGPVPAGSVERLLALLREVEVDGRVRRLYPSAGDTYAVQTYLHVRPGAVRGLDEGLYYHDPCAHTLRLITPDPGIDRSAHFYYNREMFDRSAFGLYLIGQRHGIAPLYQEQSERFLTLEAGGMGQLLMTGQASCGVGLCPVGTVAFDGLRDRFGLDDGHVLLHAFLGGAAGHASAESAPYATAPAATAGTASAGTAGAAEVAVIGMDGRFPGADDLDAYWDLLHGRRRATGPPPPGRAAALASGPGGGEGITGGFLDGVDRFESLAFRIAPAEAAGLDPQLRLLLEAVWRCLDHSGHTPDSLRAEAPRVGVFTATMWHDHQQAGQDVWRAGTGPATASALGADIPNRISHVFGFDGPSLAVNTSCSSSLTALHLAVESLRRGECDAAVVGAAGLILHPSHLALLARAGLLAEPGSAATAFSADASGWCPGEGAGALLLRPAAAARAAGDTVHAVVEGTSVGHRGGGGRFGTPAPAPLAASIRAALDRAGVAPGDIQYVECAAAGAAVADAAEVEALAEVFAGLPPVLAGSVKPNIGHLEAASGLSQVVKVLLQMRHGRVAPTLAADRLSPLVDWDAVPLRIPREPAGWPEPAGGAPRPGLVTAGGGTGPLPPPGLAPPRPPPGARPRDPWGGGPAGGAPCAPPPR
ncbi:beta-ketoacyl synthase N-terminal-like domain-containing protein, partial [Streptomyces specialis]|uniref:beta-ketoacyl synthase N-terminal-like domain-containing protein n=1 Tax=Streptomyces specialis TaxID=498367 RepID=UPI0022773372